MKPWVYSKRQEENIGTKWQRDGFDISYWKNSQKTSIITKAIDEVSNEELKKELYKRIKVLHTLTFKYTFVYENDIVFFAHFYPYTFTDLEKYLAKTTALDENKKIMRVDILWKSLSNNPCYMLTITNKIKTYLGSQDEAMLLKKSNAGREMMIKKMQRYEDLLAMADKANKASAIGSKKKSIKKKIQPQIKPNGKNMNVFTEKHFNPNENFSNYLRDHKHKKGIVITGRVHPGESNSSFVVEGIINFLLSNCKEAVHLRNNFVFKILPMINPDGVVYGNYRCSLLGVDLNRRWNNPSKILHPIIYNAKQLVKMLDTERGVSLFTDIHGHSRKKNVFMYGWNVNNFEPMSGKNNDMIRLLPFMINERNKLFSYKDWKFAVEKEKENTARIVLFKEIGIMNWYTLEASFYGGEWLGKVVYEEETSSGSESNQEEQIQESSEDEQEDEEDEPDDDQNDTIIEDNKLDNEIPFGISTKDIDDAELTIKITKPHYNSESEGKRIKLPANTELEDISNISNLPEIEADKSGDQQESKEENPEKQKK